MIFLARIFFILLITLPLLAKVPNLIPVQGILTEADGKVINGNIDLTLSLFNTETNGHELWKEKRDDFDVKNGYVSLYLGEVEEIDTSVLTKASELWLEIIFNNEKMPRVRLASVPFALEAINAQRIGNVTDTQINNMFNTGCSEGYYIKGYDFDGNSICAEDKIGESQETITYTAGKGISIDNNNNISVLDTLYSSGSGIQINNGVISVDNDVSKNSHDHRNNYYEKVNEPANNNLVKFSGSPLNGYKLEKSEISETNGELTINSLDSTAINNSGHLETRSIKTTSNLEVDGDLTLKNGQILNQMTITNTEYYIENLVNASTDIELEMTSTTGSICFLTRVRIGIHSNAYQQSYCSIVTSSNGKWKLQAYQDNANTNIHIKCGARCLTWNNTL